MIKMKRFCVVCGKELEIVLNEDFKIISGGRYWKFSTKKQGVDFSPKSGEEQKEYWECEACMKDDEDECKDNIESEA